MGFKIENILGEVVAKEDLKVFDSGFQIQTVVIKTYDDYPEFMALDFKKDDVNKLKNINVGDHVEAACFAGGREWVPGGDKPTRYFAGYSGTFIKKADETVGHDKAGAPPYDKVEFKEGEGDLPF